MAEADERKRLGDVTVGEAKRAVVYAAATVLAVDRKSTRLNSSHVEISYAVFCLKKKNAAQQDGAGAPGTGQPDFSVRPQAPAPQPRLDDKGDSAHADATGRRQVRVPDAAVPTDG